MTFMLVAYKTSDPYLSHTSILRDVCKIELNNERIVKISTEPEQYIFKKADSDSIEKDFNADNQSGMIIISDMLGGIRKTKTGENQKITLRKYTGRYVIFKIENID